MELNGLTRGKAEPPTSPQPPTLGTQLRRLRTDRLMTREKLGFATGTSASYIAHLERGLRERPGTAIVDALTRGLGQMQPLSLSDRRHLLDLAGVTDEEIPDVAELGTEMSGDVRTYLLLQEPNPAAYLDIRWNVLAANESFAAVFPGVVEDGNLMRWIFGNPAARQALPDWRREAESAAAVLRGWVGRFGDASWVVELLDELGTYPAFRRRWGTGTVEFVRRRPSVIRDPASADKRKLHIKVFRASSERYPELIYFFLGILCDYPARRADHSLAQGIAKR